MSKRENKTAAAEFRELVGVDFDEFTRQAPVKLLLAIGKYAEPTEISPCCSLPAKIIPCSSSNGPNWCVPYGMLGRSMDSSTGDRLLM
jgi:hypothetical protein